MLWGYVDMGLLWSYSAMRLCYRAVKGLCCYGVMSCCYGSQEKQDKNDFQSLTFLWNNQISNDNRTNTLTLTDT